MLNANKQTHLPMSGEQHKECTFS